LEERLELEKPWRWCGREGKRERERERERAAPESHAQKDRRIKRRVGLRSTWRRRDGADGTRMARK
jgi:hypothetical protein